MDAGGHNDRSHQRVGASDGDRDAVFERGRPARIEGIEQDEDRRL